MPLFSKLTKEQKDKMDPEDLLNEFRNELYPMACQLFEYLEGRGVLRGSGHNMANELGNKAGPSKGI